MQQLVQCTKELGSTPGTRKILYWTSKAKWRKLSLIIELDNNKLTGQNRIDLLDEWGSSCTVEIGCLRDWLLFVDIKSIVLSLLLHFKIKYNFKFWKDQAIYQIEYHSRSKSFKGFSTVSKKILGLLVSSPNRLFKYSLIDKYSSYFGTSMPSLRRCLNFFLLKISCCQPSGEKFFPLRIKNQ